MYIDRINTFVGCFDLNTINFLYYIYVLGKYSTHVFFCFFAYYLHILNRLYLKGNAWLKSQLIRPRYVYIYVS